MLVFKKILTVSLSFFMTGYIVAQKPSAKPGNLPTANNSAPLTLHTSEDSIQYALGNYVGKFILRSGFVSVNLDYFLSGLADIFNKKPGLINDTVVLPLILQYQTANQKKIGKKLEELLFSNIKDQPNLGKLPTGVQYAIIKPGKGLRPLDTDSVLIHFRGSLPDGTIFEDTYTKNTPLVTTPSSLIPGLNEAIQLMPLGANWQVYIPSAQAYGEKGSGVIPPNSAIVILVELLEIKRK